MTSTHESKPILKKQNEPLRQRNCCSINADYVTQSLGRDNVMKRVYILSAKFAAGHFSHMTAFYRLFEELNMDACLLLDKGYAGFLAEYPEYRNAPLEDADRVQADILLIYNLSTKDSKIITLMKKRNPELKIFFVYHEPWYGFSGWICDFLKQNETLIASIKAFGRHVFVKNVLRHSDCVLLASNAAVEIYKKYDAKYNKNYKFRPLLFRDEANGTVDLADKKYFSFISTADSAKNFLLFLEFVKYKSRKDATSLFQIATRVDIAKYIDSELADLMTQNKLIINHGHNLTNEEINYAYSVSNCTWLLYKRSTQSGVLGKATMFGSPVIASDIGSFSETVNGENGIILPDGYSLEDINRAYEHICNNLKTYSENARTTFLDKFYYSNQIERFSKEILHNKH